MNDNMIPIKTVLMSVTDKTGLTSFAQDLNSVIPNLQILASGGTAKELANSGIAYTAIEDYTRFPECFGGRVKTLHPFVMGGILFRRGMDDQEAERLGIYAIDLVVCNLYDFAKAAAEQETSMQKLVEQMDIGGSTLIRSACKNFAHVAIAVDPSDYPSIMSEIQANQGYLSLATRERLAIKAMHTSADYEALLSKEFSKRLSNEETQRPRLIRGRQLRYGENPDQKAWVYEFEGQQGIAQAQILSGKEISYNNYEDATVAYYAAQDLDETGHSNGVAIVKHGSLCAYATGVTLGQAFEKAWEGDSKSSFGSVIAMTTEVGDTLIPIIKDKFIEVLISPSFSDSFVQWAKTVKPNVRLLKISLANKNPYLYKNISGGMLVQTQKNRQEHPAIDSLFKIVEIQDKKSIGIVTKRQPNANIKGLCNFAISAVHYAKSNAIAIVREYHPGYYQVLGMGAGQPNRIDSLQRLAIPKAIDNLRNEHPNDPHYDPKNDLSHCVMASDGFFPFDDSVQYAASQGIKTIVQPGGSTRDPEVISTADKLDMCMILTGQRYFYH